MVIAEPGIDRAFAKIRRAEIQIVANVDRVAAARAASFRDLHGAARKGVPIRSTKCEAYRPIAARGRRRPYDPEQRGDHRAADSSGLRWVFPYLQKCRVSSMPVANESRVAERSASRLPAEFGRTLPTAALLHGRA